MKILCLALNSRYVHSNLALGYLVELARGEGHEADLKEYTINMNLREILLDCDFQNYDVICLSLYIWNGRQMLDLVKDMRAVHPKAIYFLGGPEATSRVEEYLPYCDGVVMGEGESPWKSFLAHPNSSSHWRGIRRDEQYVPQNKEEKLDFPYPYFQIPGQKIIYYESQRGCPFGCSYCMSGSTGVRFRPMSLVKKDLLYFIEQEVPLVKFVDRSFNINMQRALEIIHFIKKHDIGKTSFHMELAPHLLPQVLEDALRDVRKDLFQVEIGIQSVEDEVNRLARRNLFYLKYRDRLESFIQSFPGHVHLDLICGLPGSTFDNIRWSHLELSQLKPDFIQLGFLKVMPGTLLYEEKEQYGICCSAQAPYEVLETKDLPFSTLKLLKAIERMMDLYPREEIPMTMDYLTTHRGAFDVYWWMAEHFPKHRLYEKLSLENRLLLLGEFSPQVVRETLELDYRRKRRNRRYLFFPGREEKENSTLLSYYDGVGLSHEPVFYQIDYETQGLRREENHDS